VRHSGLDPHVAVSIMLRIVAGAAAACIGGIPNQAMVRGYRASDRDEVERVLRGLGWEERFIAGQLRAVDRLSALPTATVFVDDDAGSLRGFVSVELHEWNSLAQLHGLAVDTAHRRRGAATALVAAAESFARDAGARGIYADTPVDDVTARTFYERRGYSAGYVMSRYYADDLDGVTYVRFFGPRRIAE
jgi:ribosomal protein S18 acetylase RimI-like enzyme